MPSGPSPSSATILSPSRMPRRPHRHLATAVMVLLPAMGLAQQEPIDPGAGMNHLVPGDSRRGSQVFQEKGCSACHHVRGAGSASAPSLLRQTEQPLTEGEVAARLWNHGPMMWDFMRSQGQSPATLSPDEMSDLFAFLIRLSYADEPGEAGLGELLFRSKGCDDCHRPNAAARPEAPDIRYWGAHRSPLSLARAMWNHADAMWSHVRERGQLWPRLDGAELSHIVAYVRQVNTVANSEEIILGDPARGQELFADKGCAGCHAEGSDDSRRAPKVGQMGGSSLTLAGLAAGMWSHYPDMVTALGDRELRWAPLGDKEMADLLAYLFAEGLLEQKGDPARGRNIFAEKLCAYCHAGTSPAGPRLEQFRQRATPADFACALWNHGPRMSAWMREKGVTWPELDRQEILDLLSFLSQPE